MNKKLCTILILILFAILIWFLLFFKIEFEIQGFIYKDKNTIYCITSNNLMSQNLKLKFNEHIYFANINLIKCDSGINIYFFDNLNLKIEEQKMVPIKIFKNETIIKILF